MKNVNLVLKPRPRLAVSKCTIVQYSMEPSQDKKKCYKTVERHQGVRMPQKCSFGPAEASAHPKVLHLDFYTADCATPHRRKRPAISPTTYDATRARERGHRPTRHWYVVEATGWCGAAKMLRRLSYAPHHSPHYRGNAEQRTTICYDKDG